MKQIPLTQGKFAIVDDEDFEWLRQKKWHIRTGKNTYYAGRSEHINKKKVVIYMHRKIMNVPKDLQIDHINHNGLDNRRCNLRICTNNQNHQNQISRPNSKSKYKGVYWHKSNKKWIAQIRSKDEVLYIGCYNNEINAAKAYDSKAKEYFGEFAYLNF